MTIETGQVSETLCSFEHWPMDKVQNPVIPNVIHHHQNLSEVIPIWAFTFISTVLTYLQEFS
jgi:hypothetical protein